MTLKLLWTICKSGSQNIQNLLHKVTAVISFFKISGSRAWKKSFRRCRSSHSIGYIRIHKWVTKNLEIFPLYLLTTVISFWICTSRASRKHLLSDIYTYFLQTNPLYTQVPKWSVNVKGMSSYREKNERSDFNGLPISICIFFYFFLFFAVGSNINHIN